MPFQKGNKLGKLKGQHSKTQEWEELGDAIKTRHSNRFNEILDTLPDEKFIDKYLQVLEYFKPKLARTENKHEGDLTVTTIQVVRERSNGNT
jgi:hypothetical protein